MSTKTISIPELPFGYKLLFDIISTWGDPYYVGLNGIEIFLSNGMNITKLCHITTNSLDNSKMIINLIDGINWTKNDKHMWLTTFHYNKRHLIEITLPKWIQSSIGLIRIWNYNKSYIDSYCGVKDLIIYLDNQPIFYNEIHKATGLNDGHLEDFCETILFSTDNNILNLIGQNDTLLKCKQDYNNDVTMVTNDELLNKEPMIYNSIFYPNINSNLLCLSLFNSIRIWNYNHRQIGYDYSCKLINIKLKQFNSNDSILNELTILLRKAPGHLEYSFEQIIMLTDVQINYTDLHSLTTRYKYNHLPIGFVYQFNIYSNWSNQFYVGLNGIQLLSDDGTIIPIHKNQIYTYPNSINTLYSNKPFYSHICTVDKLVDNIITNNYNLMSKHCWLTSMIANEVNKIFIVFHKPICIVGIRLWNYMRIPEYGVKEFTILIDDQLIFHGYLPKFQKDFDFKYDPNYKHDPDRKFDRKNNRIQINEEKLFWTNNEHSIRSSYSVVSFDKDILIKLGENPNCILNMHRSSKYNNNNNNNNNNNIKEIDMIHEPSNYSTYTSRLKTINQTPRPSTCVTDKERFKDQV
uniref:KATNIP domain-containing protein n=1 Tax=Schistosoma haematobium TaxID=6185 RepID=A0A094ZGI2_SCHHA